MATIAQAATGQAQLTAPQPVNWAYAFQGPNHEFYAFNPATGQNERLVIAYNPLAMSDNMSASIVPGENGTAYFESDAARLNQPWTYATVARGSDDFGELVQLGLAAIAGASVVAAGMEGAAGAGAGGAEAGAGAAGAGAGAAETGTAVYGGLDGAAIAGADYGAGAAGAGAAGGSELVAGADDAFLYGGDAQTGVGDAGAFDQAGTTMNYQSPPIESTFTPSSGPTNPYTGAPTGGSSASNWLSTQTGIDPGLLQLGGTAASTLLGVYGANQQANAYGDLANQVRNDRLPYLNQSLQWLQNPASYYETGPAQQSMDAVLRGLSVNGNPAGNPAAQAAATQAGMLDWRNAVLGFGNLGLGGQHIQAGLGSQEINADANVYNAIGAGINDMTQPRSSLDDFFRAYQRGLSNRSGL